MAESERERIAREYDEALEALYEREKALRAAGKHPHEVVGDQEYKDKEARIRELREESRALAKREAGRPTGCHCDDPENDPDADCPIHGGRGRGPGLV